MTVVTTLPTRRSREWHEAMHRLTEAVAVSGCAILTGHLSDAAAETDAHAAPTRRWADHVAMVETTALRRAALATSGRARLHYIDIADEARRLLAISTSVHGIHPSARADRAVQSAHRDCFTRI